MKLAHINFACKNACVSVFFVDSFNVNAKIITSFQLIKVYNKFSAFFFFYFLYLFVLISPNTRPTRPYFIRAKFLT